MLEDVIQDVGKYSLILDESTDVSTTKFLAVCIRNVSLSSKRINTAFLKPFPIVSTTAVLLTEAVCEFLKAV